MSTASEEKPPSVPERYFRGSPRYQLDFNRLSRLGALGVARRVPCGENGQNISLGKLSTNNDLNPCIEDRPTRCQDSVATASLSLTESSEARKRKADRDAPISWDRSVSRQEEGRIYSNSRNNVDSFAEIRKLNSSREVLNTQDKENINPFYDPRGHQLKKQVFVRSSEKRCLQVSKSTQNVSIEKKVGSLLIKRSFKPKTVSPLESTSKPSAISQDGSEEVKQQQQITLPNSVSRSSTIEKSIRVQADQQVGQDMLLIPADSANTPQFDSLVNKCNIDVPYLGSNKMQNASDKSKIHYLLKMPSDLQDVGAGTILPEEIPQGAVLNSVRELSSSMNGLAIVDNHQADSKKDLMNLSKNSQVSLPVDDRTPGKENGFMLSGKAIQGSCISDEKSREANGAPNECPPLQPMTGPSATACSYTIQTDSAPAPTSHTAESVQSLGQQNGQPFITDRPIPVPQTYGSIVVQKADLEVNDMNRVKPTSVENEMMKANIQRSSQGIVSVSDAGASKLIQHLHLPENKSVAGDAAMQPRKQGENEHFVWVNRRRYQKLKKIGRGGSSEVYKVIDRDGDIYALKRIKLKGRDYATAYGFYQEIELLTKLQGKNYIIRLIDHEVTDKNLFSSNLESSQIVKHDAYIYMVLEFGEIDLASMLHEKQKERVAGSHDVDETWLRFYWRQILEAVNTVHEERIIHSDLKPANFLLVKGVLKLIDFGIAKSIHGDTTNIQRDAQVGTLNYMSPEAFLMNEKDENGNVIKCGRPSDIWSLGCILYQMVYGKTPFAHITALHAKIQEVANPKHKIDFPYVSNPHLLDIMNKCLAYKREDRLRIPELLNHPFLQPMGCTCSQAKGDVTGDVRGLTKLLKRSILSQVHREQKLVKDITILAEFLEQLSLFEQQMK
ncbi:hypothetical protein KP509_01G109000 [Ceratopteris richardii]|uniref:Protein kinase domain-containing protein n=1 Tax=Ceratopteris richardii TaxID=49495 RepID=A0A8T2VPN9_CERRI|nr:hypothetical protein KP509_01G109000 [Ceratopteris richardii]